MILDTHTHFYDPARPQGVPWPPPAERTLYRTVLPAHYRALAEPLGITGTVVVEASAWVEDNQWVLDLAAGEPFVRGLVGNLDPRTPSFAADLERFARNPLFRGLRWGSAVFADPDAAARHRACAEMARRNLVLDALVGPAHLDAVAAAARAVPDLRIVVNHLAQAGIDGRAPNPDWAAAVRRVAAAPRVFMKGSAAMELSRTQPAPTDVGFYAPVLDTVWEAFGPERVLYGSDWPVCERAGTLAAALGLVQTYVAARGADAADRYFHRNAAAVYQCPAR